MNDDELEDESEDEFYTNILDEEEVPDDKVIEELDHETNEMLFDNDLANDNLDNDDDIIE